MMSKLPGYGMGRHAGRRDFMRGTAILGAALAAPAIRCSPAHAADAELAPYLEAKVNWRQTEGEAINVAVIPANFFAGLLTFTPQFEALTGIKVTYESIPPGQIRNKTVLDLNTKTGAYSTHAADPMYYPLYVSNRWIEPLDPYLQDAKLTDPAWYEYEDIVPAWRSANSIDNKLYGVPFQGDATLQVYRTDLYDARGLKPAATFDEYVANAAAVHDPDKRVWGAALRGFPGPGQNMFIYPSIFRAFGGKWFDAGGKVTVNGPEAEAALQWYANLDNKFAPKGVENWNWPDIADAFAQGTLGSFIDGFASAPVLANPQKSKVVGNIGFARWPAGPSGKRVTALWNWGLPINAAISPRAKRATWLYIAWATSRETMARMSYKMTGPSARDDVIRLSILKLPEYQKTLSAIGRDFLSASQDTIADDIDIDWRPRIPQWPLIGETMAVAIQQAVSSQAKPKAALDEAQKRIEQGMKG
jgi:multiple sugar transport system substrate-binding protein